MNSNLKMLRDVDMVDTVGGLTLPSLKQVVAGYQAISLIVTGIQDKKPQAVLAGVGLLATVLNGGKKG